MNKKPIKSLLSSAKKKVGFLVDTTLKKYPEPLSPRQKDHLEKRKKRNRFA